ncbi:hypothetical protein V1509DRAFT_625434 [Lipomyces kononenkoae]
MSLLAYIRNSHHYNIQNSSSPVLSATPIACGSSTSYLASAAVYSQSHSSPVPHRHDHKGVRPIARVWHHQNQSSSPPPPTSTIKPQGSNCVDQGRRDKLSIHQMTDEARYSAEGPYEHDTRQQQQQQQLQGTAAIVGQCPPGTAQGDISPTTRLPSIQNLLTTAATTGSGAPATSSPAGNPAAMYINPSGSSTSSIATETLGRSSISSCTSSQSTSSAPARLSPAMATTATSATTTPTPQSGYVADSGTRPEQQQVPHTASARATPTMATAAVLQMPTSVYPQQQQFIYPGPAPPPPPPSAPALAMPAPQIHPPAHLAQYGPVPMPIPQPYYIASAPSPAQGTAYPPTTNPYAGLQMHPHPGLAQAYPPIRPVALGPGMPSSIGAGPVPGPPGPPVMPGVQSHLAPLKPKRKRATQQQVNRLNEVFQQTFFPSTEQRLELSRELGMTPRTVQIWFQNRRQGWRAESRRSTGTDAPYAHDDQGIPQNPSPSSGTERPREPPGEGMEGEYDVREE